MSMTEFRRRTYRGSGHCEVAAQLEQYVGSAAVLTLHLRGEAWTVRHPDLIQEVIDLLTHAHTDWVAMRGDPHE